MKNDNNSYIFSGRTKIKMKTKKKQFKINGFIAKKRKKIGNHLYGKKIEKTKDEVKFNNDSQNIDDW